MLTNQSNIKYNTSKLKQRFEKWREHGPRELILKDLLSCLIDLAEKGSSTHSICSHVYSFFREGYKTNDYCISQECSEALHFSAEILRAIMVVWPKFSGDEIYPVPSPVPWISPEAAYLKLSRWESEYGDLRRELLDFCIDTLQKQLEV